MYNFNIIRASFIYTFVTNIINLLKSWFEGVLFFSWVSVYLTIIPWARMGSELIAHEAEGWMGYWRRGHEGERNNCFSKIQLIGQKYRE